MKKGYLLLCFIVILLNQGIAQVKLSGFVKDAQSREVCIGANILDTKNNIGVSTDKNGYFSFQSKNNVDLSISFIGYETQNLHINSPCDSILIIYLKPRQEIIDEVNIVSQKSKNPNYSTLSRQQLQSVPSLSGQPDVMKSLSILPGIQTNGELSSQISVRGGDPGQNLYLLDNSTLSYVNHFAGFMSVFIPDIINDIKVYKGGFPAEYGNKLSSIIDISQRSGEMTAPKGAISLGITDFNGFIEGKLSEKSSFIVAGRKTAFDPLIALAAKQDNYTVFYGFHDINVKTTHNLDIKNQLFFNAYYGDDYFVSWRTSMDDNYHRTKSNAKNVWGNWLVAGNWLHSASSKSFIHTTLSVNQYRIKNKFKTKGDNEKHKQKKVSSKQNITLKTKWNYRISPWLNTISGIQSSLNIFSVFQKKTPGFNVAKYYDSGNVMLSSSAFANGNFDITKFLKLQLGVRFNHYHLYKLNTINIEPRLQIEWIFAKNNYLTFNYAEMHQDSHLISLPSIVMQNEIWLPISHRKPPEHSKQISLGYSRNIENNKYSIECLTYYKAMENLLYYRNYHFGNVKDNFQETGIDVGGKGIAYGLEISAQKNRGSWTGLLSYNYMKTTRQFETINNNQAFDPKYSRPHNFNILLSKQLNEKWSFNIAWTYKTGLPYTPAIGRQISIAPEILGSTDYYETLIYDDINSKRMKDYHRLDISANYTTYTKRGNKAVWTFGVYNVYNRKNPSFYFYNNNPSLEFHHSENDGLPNENLKLYQMSILPVFPSFSVKIYFDEIKFSKDIFNFLKYE